MRGERQIFAQPLAVLGREQLLGVISVAGDERCACGFDRLTHRVIGVIENFVPLRDQLADDAEGRIGMPISGNAEKNDLAHGITFFGEDYNINILNGQREKRSARQ